MKEQIIASVKDRLETVELAAKGKGKSKVSKTTKSTPKSTHPKRAKGKTTPLHPKYPPMDTLHYKGAELKENDRLFQSIMKAYNSQPQSEEGSFIQGYSRSGIIWGGAVADDVPQRLKKLLRAKFPGVSLENCY